MTTQEASAARLVKKLLKDESLCPDSRKLIHDLNDIVLSLCQERDHLEQELTRSGVRLEAYESCYVQLSAKLIDMEEKIAKALDEV